MLEFRGRFGIGFRKTATKFGLGREVVGCKLAGYARLMSSLTILSLEKQSVQTGFDPGVELATKVQPLLRDIVIVPPS
jgi:hypothetical protein